MFSKCELLFFRPVGADCQKENTNIYLVAKACSLSPLLFGDEESVANRDFKALSFNLDAKRKNKATWLNYGTHYRNIE